MNVGGRTTRVEVSMPHHVLSKDEVHANMQRREHARDFIQIRMQTEGYEPSDTEVLGHLNL